MFRSILNSPTYVCLIEKEKKKRKPWRSSVTRVRSASVRRFALFVLERIIRITLRRGVFSVASPSFGLTVASGASLRNVYTRRAFEPRRNWDATPRHEFSSVARPSFCRHSTVRVIDENRLSATSRPSRSDCEVPRHDVSANDRNKSAASPPICAGRIRRVRAEPAAGPSIAIVEPAWPHRWRLSSPRPLSISRRRTVTESSRTTAAS